MGAARCGDHARMGRALSRDSRSVNRGTTLAPGNELIGNSQIAVVCQGGDAESRVREGSAKPAHAAQTMMINETLFGMSVSLSFLWEV